MEHSAKDTYVVTNNHYVGKAVVNAFEISSILKDEALPMPPELVERYPELEPFAKKRDLKHAESGRLFD